MENRIQIEVGQVAVIDGKPLVCLEVVQSDYCAYEKGGCDAVGHCAELACCKEVRSDGKNVVFIANLAMKPERHLIELAPGTRFVINGETFVVEEAPADIKQCGRCGFYKTPKAERCLRVECQANRRKDGKEVIFYKLEDENGSK
jgi:hypothetical protein